MIVKRTSLLVLIGITMACNAYSADSTGPQEKPLLNFATMVVGDSQVYFSAHHIYDASSDDTTIATAVELPTLGAMVTCVGVGTTTIWGIRYYPGTGSNGYTYGSVTCVHDQGGGG